MRKWKKPLSLLLALVLVLGGTVLGSPEAALSPISSSSQRASQWLSGCPQAMTAAWSVSGIPQ